MKVGYIGLGALGNELARRFLANYEVWVWDMNPAATERLVAAGAHRAVSPAQVARESEVLLLCLPRSVDVRELLFGSGGVAESLSSGKMVIDQTSGVPQETQAMAQRLAKRGVTLLDAAVSGSPHLVPQGLATLMVAGEEGDFERAKPILTAITPTIYYCGRRVGDGQAMKMVNNAMNAGVRMGTLELVALGRKAGLTLECLTIVLNKGGAANITTERMLPAIALGKQATNFALSLMLKDINQAAMLGIEMHVPMPLTGAVRSLLQIGLNQRGEQARLEEMISVIEAMAGTHYVDSPLAAGDENIDSLPSSDPGPLNVGLLGFSPFSAAVARGPRGPEAMYVYDERVAITKGFESEGLVTVDEPTAMAAACNVLLVSGATADATHDALFGKHAIAKHLMPHAVIVDFSPAGAEYSGRLAEGIRHQGAALLEACVLAGPKNGRFDGSLVLCSGPFAAFARVKPLLERSGAEAVYCGALGNARSARIVTHAAIQLCRQMTYESVAAGCKFGLRLEDMAEILHKTSGWSAASRELLPALLAGRLPTDELIHEVAAELRLAAGLAIGYGAPTTMMNAVCSWLADVANRCSATASQPEMKELIESAAGIQFRATPLVADLAGRRH